MPVHRVHSLRGWWFNCQLAQHHCHSPKRITGIVLSLSATFSSLPPQFLARPSSWSPEQQVATGGCLYFACPRFLSLSLSLSCSLSPVGYIGSDSNSFTPWIKRPSRALINCPRPVVGNDDRKGKRDLSTGLIVEHVVNAILSALLRGRKGILVFNERSAVSFSNVLRDSLALRSTFE